MSGKSRGMRRKSKKSDEKVEIRYMANSKGEENEWDIKKDQ